MAKVSKIPSQKASHDREPSARTRPVFDAIRAARARGLTMSEAVWQHGAVRASYFHAWFPSCPAFSWIAAPLGVNFDALFNRFPVAWANRVKSPSSQIGLSAISTAGSAYCTIPY